MSENKMVWSDCASCSRSTQHDVLCEEKKEDVDYEAGYHYAELWQIVECRGCSNVSFRKNTIDYNSYYEDEHGNSHIDETTIVYPKVIKDHKKIGGFLEIPGLINKIYDQTLSAYSDQAYILAGIGMRATIEAVCNHLNIQGSNLEKRIDALFKNGYVSNEDKKRLHAIRFLGNDAAHEIKAPSEKDLRVALAIIEHMLNSVFILSGKSKSLELTIENFEDFEELLKKMIKLQHIGSVMNLPFILKDQKRRTGQKYNEFETELITRINDGRFDYLSLESQTTSPTTASQLYKVVRTN